MNGADSRARDREELERRRNRRTALIRLVAVIMLGGAGILALRHPAVREHLTEEQLIALLESVRAHPLAIPGLLVAFAVLACLGTPVTLLMLSTGAVYGVFPGFLLALLASLLSGVVTFTVVKVIGQDFDLDRFGDLRKRVERQLNRHGFWNLVSFRFIPIPWAVANGILALTGVRLSMFIASSTLALLPTTIAWTYFAQSIVGATDASRTAAFRNIGVGLVGLLALSLVPEVLRRVRRRRRLEALRSQRKGRNSVGSGSTPR